MDSICLRRGPVSLSPDCERVTNADEEIFILYSELQCTNETQAADNFRGLGYIDSHKDVLEVKFQLRNGSPPAPGPQQSSKKKKKSHKAAKTLEDKDVDIQLFQDITALHSRKGDTGSVLWRASFDFAHLALQQLYSNPSTSLFDGDKISTQNVLELGAGTGLLSIALSPLVNHYTATDVGPLIPLIRKNVALNFPGWPSNEKGANISVEELDWIDFSSSSPSQRTQLYDTGVNPIDLLLVVDCIYHPSLIQPLITTVDSLVTTGQTAVLVVSELRAHDVMREFIEVWLGKSGWEIWRFPNDDIGKRYCLWLGWKA